MCYSDIKAHQFTGGALPRESIGWKGHFEAECSQKIDEPVWFSHIIGRTLEKRGYNKCTILRKAFPRWNWQALYCLVSSSYVIGFLRIANVCINVFLFKSSLWYKRWFSMMSQLYTWLLFSSHLQKGSHT